MQRGFDFNELIEIVKKTYFRKSYNINYNEIIGYCTEGDN